MNSSVKYASVAALIMASAIGVSYAQSASGQPPAPPSTENQESGWGEWLPWRRGHGHGRHGGHEMGDCRHEAGYDPGDEDGPGWGRRGPMGEGGPGGDRPFGRMLTMVDGNGDGVISDDEAAARVEGVFAAMDADDNGEVTLDEFVGLRMGPGEGRNPERMKLMQDARKQRFEAMDADKDGKVTKAQFLDAAKARFAAADTDKDGKVTPWEFRAQHNPVN